MLGAVETTNTTPLRDGGKLADAARIGNMGTVKERILGTKLRTLGGDVFFSRFLTFSGSTWATLTGPYKLL